VQLQSINELERIAESASDAAEKYSPDRERAVEAEYVRLRGQAEALNRRYGWASAEEFDTLFPTLDAQATLAELERSIDTTGLPSEVEPGAPAQRHLRHLSYWASAVALAARSAQEF
jgi:hypothetical protein